MTDKISKEIHNKLFKDPEYLMRLLESYPSLFYLYDYKNSLPVYANKNLYIQLGYSIEEIKKFGSNLDKHLLHPDDINVVVINRNNTNKAKDGEMIESDYRLKHKSGKWVWFHNTVSVFERDKNGEVYLTVGTIQNITKSKQAEEELIESRERLRNLSSHLQAAREEERKQVAREIHDELGQSLTALKLDLSLCSSHFPDTPENKKVINTKMPGILKLVDDTISKVRKISTRLRPSLLDNSGLVPALEWQINEFQKRTNIKCKTKFIDDDSTLDKDMSMAIFRICQESLTNVARHAKAKNVTVILERKNGSLVMEVKDDGIGINESKILNSQSFGLLGMKERAKYFGGKMTINSLKEKGTSVKAEFPVDSE